MSSSLVDMGDYERECGGSSMTEDELEDTVGISSTVGDTLRVSLEIPGKCSSSGGLHKKFKAKFKA